MRLAIGMAAICTLTVGAHASARYAAIHAPTVASDVAETLSFSGAGTSSVGVSGGLGPVGGGAPMLFSITIDLSFESFSVPGDGFVSFLSLHPSFATGDLEVTGFSLTSDLYAGASAVSHLSGVGSAPMVLAAGGTTTLSNFAFAYDVPGAPAFGFIGDNGTLSATVEFEWTGSSAGDELVIDVMPGSEFRYAFAIPTPGGAFVMGLGVLGLVRRGRGGGGD